MPDTAPEALSTPETAASSIGNNDAGTALFKMTLLTPREYVRMGWKNGLGTTDEIWVDPPGANFRQDPFVYRLSSAQVSASCSFSLFPHCQNTIVLLPRFRSDLGVPAGDKAPVFRIRHNGEVTPHVVRPLMPYTYEGAWSTTCDIPAPAQDITLIVCRCTILLTHIVGAQGSRQG
jgi:hypothetical protein